MAEALDDVSRASRPPARVVITSVATAIAGNRTTTLTLLSGAVGLAMVIAFANLAGLLSCGRSIVVASSPSGPPWGHARRKSSGSCCSSPCAIVALGTIGGVLLAWWMTPVVANLVLGRVPGERRDHRCGHQLAGAWRA